jgi:hypothetical protein
LRLKAAESVKIINTKVVFLITKSRNDQKMIKKTILGNSDRKSVAYRFQYRATDRTLKAEEVDTAHQKVLATLTQKLGVKFR